MVTQAQPFSINQGCSWKPPPLDWYNVYIDGSLYEHDQSSGIVLVSLFDSNMAAMCNRINGVFQVPEIEALAMEIGMLFAYYMGFRRIMMEGDCICTVRFSPL